jgi:hypothetical protein
MREARSGQRGKGNSSAGGRRHVARRSSATAWRAWLALGLLLLAGVALAGCGDGGGRPLPADWRGRDLTEPGWANGTLKPGWGLGLEYVWPAGAEIEWDWFVNGSGVLHYQVVRVEQGQAQPLLSRFGNESTAGLTVPRAGAHQILWRNEGYLDVRFWYKVPEGHGTPRLYSPTQGPDCTVVLARPSSVC